ncbi:YdeI/OmpD-associated family protein [Mucilaginibacter sp. UR6-1]|uniref:YdeI/OmpD-associated family protein n=1 Tax=Mucilaginibacter sp. UR6-1 TaxID=1435643 RepID=UPI001E41946D|nr:YdeI/OmpD-associated family protein [Mucilaginibacter sp. UR6-1]MCC8407386.1 YdeI/OmpD-associated family protein [Mucilaginibacter sp. UR6-1]
MISALAKKLQMKTGQHWLLLNAPNGYPALLEPHDDITISTDVDGKFNGVQLFVTTGNELDAFLKLLKNLLQPDTVLWVIYPKKNSGITTDLEMMDNGLDIMAQYGLRPVTSAAIDKTWTSLRYKPEELVKKSDSRNEAIQQNDYGRYINTEQKTVILPPDALEALSDHPAAISYFEKLAYSNKKEYVVWILSAKQEKTRQSRIEKMVQMLLDNKKNPADK